MKNVDLERAVLGAILNSCDIPPALSEDDFSTPEHVAIFRAALETREAEGVVDLILIQNHLPADLSRAYVAELIDVVVIPDNLPQYAKSLKELGALRSLQGLAARLEDKLKGGKADPAILIQSLMDDITSLRDRAGIKTWNLPDAVRSWVDQSFGTFRNNDIYTSLSLRDRRDKQVVNNALHRLEGKGIIEKIVGRNGEWRRIETNMEVINPFDAPINKLDVVLPLGEHNLINIYPKNQIVIAGAPNAGKSCYCLNVVRFNMKKYRFFYFSSEMGGSELRMRLEHFRLPPINEWPLIPFDAPGPGVTFVERSRDFQDVIQPDAINIIDFVQISEDFYRISRLTELIHDKLREGICILCLQKKRGEKHEMGRGAEFSMEKPRLYLAMDQGRAKIVKAKNIRPGIPHPENMVMRFQITGGGSDIDPKGNWQYES